MKKVYFFLFLSINLICFAQRTKVMYLANEGIMIQDDSTKIIIDGFFKEDLGLYEVPKLNDLQDMKSADGLYSNVTYILVTHEHKDHFDKDLINKYLSINKKCKVISSNQILKQLDPKYKNRFVGFEFNSYDKWYNFEESNVRIKMGRMIHPYKKNQNIVNLAYNINLNGYYYLHIGDADMIEKNFKKLNLQEFKFENVFIPFWFLVEERGKILANKYLNSKYISAIHFQKNFNLSKIDAKNFKADVNIFKH